MAEKAKTPFVNVAEKIMLEAGPLKFPALDKPDTSKYSLGKCKDGVYKTGILYKKDSKFLAKLTKQLDKIYDEGVKAVAKEAASMPTKTAKEKEQKKAFETIYPKNDYFKNDTDKDGEETGYVVLNAKLNATTGKGAKNTFVLIDAAKKPMSRSTPIWGGTVAKVQVLAKFYNLIGPKQSGVSFEILGVQIIDLKGPNGGPRVQGSADDFSEEDGYSAPDSADEPNDAQDGGDADETEPF